MFKNVYIELPSRHIAEGFTQKLKGIKMETLELIAQTIATIVLIGFWPFGFWYLDRESMKSIDKRIEEYKNNNK